MKAYPREKRTFFRIGLGLAAGLILLGSTFSERVAANPVGPSVVAGGVVVSGMGTNQVIINQTTPQAILSWQQFNIAPNEVTRFIQPSAQAIALNRIFDANPSQILGSLQANGSVILLNPNGVLFGAGAQVNVSGLIASSLNLSDADFLAGRYHFEGSLLNGTIKNAGTITTSSGGGVYLLAPNVENSGVIKTPEGQLVLAAGTSAYLSNRPDGQGFLIKIDAPSGEALNLKDLVADGGTINIYGRVINQKGLIQANSVREKEGRIEFFASETLNLASGSVTSAKGSDQGVSNGGAVVAVSDKTQGQTHFDSGAVIDVSGGAEGGNGGSVEISGHQLTLGGTLLARASSGYVGGEILLDPFDLTLGQDDFDMFINSGAAATTFQADNNITVKDVGADLSGASFSQGSRGSLVFQAGNDLAFQDTYILNNPSLAGRSDGPPWDISATAGRDIVLSHSFLGTGSGGNMTISAGRNIISPSIYNTDFQMYTGIRMDTDIPGTLKITAGGDFLGGFVLSSGHAVVNVGGNFGAPGQENYVNLTLGTGKIDVTAGGSIYLGLIQDQGIAERTQKTVTADPNNAINLTASSGDIHLSPIVPGTDPNAGLAPLLAIYPASFNANAMSSDAAHGNIDIESNVTFWPSPIGAINFLAQGGIFGGIGATPPNGGAPTISLIPADPDTLRGLDAGALNFRYSFILNSPSPNVSAGVVPVTFKTVTGDISNLTFNLYSPTLQKEISIESGHNLSKFGATISIPENVTATVSAAGNMDMTPNGTTDGGIHFVGTGTAQISAGGDLNLANSAGIDLRASDISSNVSISKGLLDISLGGSLEMTQSTIVTFNGASIRIHGLQGPDSPVGGSVDVGTNARSSDTPAGKELGIMTLRGGEIDITATGDVNVNSSRVATLGGGDIHITSTQGNINAGTGNKNEEVDFSFLDETKDALGNITGSTTITARVPGSGIFTYNPSDPNPLPPYPSPPALILPPPPVKTAEMVRLEHEMIKQSVLGHDISGLKSAYDKQANSLTDQYQLQVIQVVDAATQQYEEVKTEFRKDWKLGDIDLEAKNGSVVVPPAGIRGRKITIEAKNLDLQGGQISGDVDLNVGKIIGGFEGLIGPVTGSVGANAVTSISIPSIPSGGSTGAVSLGGLSGSTGSISAASSSNVTTASNAVAAVQEKVEAKAAATEPEVETVEAETAASEPGRPEKVAGGKKRSGMRRAFQIRKGVLIQVEVNEEQP